ncbi:MAG TPA: ABC transporter substrate-binding protein [Acidimicrobiales bacterium]|nr:ABC transporter substrate-binding protein [Acidimicrobiales bacterium]
MGLLATILVACSSTASQAPGGSSSNSPIPPAAFHGTTGLTSTSVRVGNISTQTIGLFTGAPTGLKAYADYVNSTGGVNGRKIIVDSADDGYNNGANNKALTQADIAKDFAMVGSFSLNDQFGAQVLGANPAVPNVTVSLSSVANKLPNSFSPSPNADGWQLGPLAYFKNKFPSDVTHAGALIADQPSATATWAGEKLAMANQGYKVVYDPTFEITTTDFTPYVINMRKDGVKILFIEQMPESYASAVFKALNQQNFHPVVVLGASTYSEALIPASGGAAATDGSYLEQNTSLYLGEDAASLPAVNLFLHWVQEASPGFKPDLYTMYGWISGQLFVQALKAAGPNPTRGSVLQALRSVKSYSASNLIASANPAGKLPGNCYIIAQIIKGTITRVDDPPITGSTNGYRCDQPYFFPPGTKPT